MSKASEAFDRRWRRGWTPIQVQGCFFSPLQQRLFQIGFIAGLMTEDELRAAHPDVVPVTESGCPKCLVGYADIMSDPYFACEVCCGTGFPVFANGKPHP